MKSTILKATFVAVALIIAVPTISMAVGPGFNPNVDDGGGCTVPLDGGLSLLAAAGIGYTARRMWKNRAQQPQKVK